MDDLKLLQIQIERLHCYHCSRTFLTKDAFTYHAHDDELSTSSTSSSSSSEEESDDSDDNSIIILNSPSNSNVIKNRATNTSKKKKKSKSDNRDSDKSDNNNSTPKNPKKKSRKSKKKTLKKVKYSFSCPIENCLAGFERYGDRKKHLEKVHSMVCPPPSAEEQEARRNYICPVETCLKRFLSASNLSSHKLTHREPTHRCPHEGCDRLFTLPYLLNKHLKERHSVPTEGSSPGFECNICSKILKTKRNLKNHIKFSHDPVISKRYKCHICPGRGFPTKSYLKDHIVRKHEGGRKDPENKTSHPCPHCERTFNHRSTRNQHVKVFHLGIKKFMCHLCAFRCTSNPRLEEHVKGVHEKLFEHLCSICGKYLSSDANLKRHMVGHTGVKPCKCPVEGCSAAYTQNPSLKIHIQKHHPELGATMNKNSNTNANTSENQGQGQEEGQGQGHGEEEENKDDFYTVY